MSFASFATGSLLLAASHSFSSGILFVQAGDYYERFWDDPRPMKWYIAIVLVVATLQTLEIIIASVNMVLSRPTIVYTEIETVMNVLLTALLQPWFMWRAYKLTRQKIATAVLIFFFLASKATCLAAVGLLANPDRTPQEWQDIHSLIIATLGCYLLVDAGITILLLMHFKRSRIGVGRMDATLQKLINITWVSAALPALALLLSFILQFAPEDTNPSTFFALISGKLYCHSLLITLNSRTSLREGISIGKSLGRMSLQERDLRQLGIIGAPRPTPAPLQTGLTGANSFENSLNTIGPDDNFSLQISDGDVKSFDAGTGPLQTLIEALRDEETGHVCPGCQGRQASTSPTPTKPGGWRCDRPLATPAPFSPRPDAWKRASW